MNKIKIGDHVICQTGVSGIVIGFYTPTACEEQTKVRTADGRLYHAPTRMWRHYKDGLNADTVIIDELEKVLPQVNNRMIVTIGPNRDILDQLRDEVLNKIAENIIYDRSPKYVNINK